MDDILKRMLAVEQEADALIAAAKTEAAKITENGRLEASKLVETVQKNLVAEAKAQIQAVQDENRHRLEAGIAKGEQELVGEIAQFRQKLTAALPKVTDALLYPDK